MAPAKQTPDVRARGERRAKPGREARSWEVVHTALLSSRGGGVVAPAEAGFLSSPPRQLLPVAVVVVLVVAAQGREAPLADGKGKEDLGARIHPHLHERKEEADPYKRPCESPRENTGKPWLMVVADLFPLLT